MRPFLLSGALLALTGVLQPPSASFAVGVLRRDALIVPFATYDGKRWRNDWPVPAENIDVPLNLRNVSKRWWGPVGPREMWQVWASDATPQMVKVRQPDWAPSYCQKVVGLRTDYQPRFRPPPPGVSPYPKDGLAVSPAHPVEAIEVLDANSRERGDVVEAIHPRFVEQEHVTLDTLIREHASNPRQVPLPPTEAELRATPSMVVEALYAYGTSPRTYFIETAREYKRHGACTIVVSGRGRVVRDSGKFKTDGFRLGLTACDRSNTSYMLPLGVMSLPTGVYWIAQVSGWDRETYNIIDITPGSRASDLLAAGGGC
jgi:hypothetical protein